MKDVSERILLRVVRLYGRFFPVFRGKRRVGRAVLRLARSSTRVPSIYGHEFLVRPHDSRYLDLIVLGAYEPEIAWLLPKIVCAGDTVLDVGANFGWYALTLAHFVGPNGSVHAFEPAVVSFRELQENLRLNQDPEWVHTNRLALGDAAGSAQIYSFSGLNSGHASTSTLGRIDSIPERCEITTIDKYLASVELKHVDLIKCDVEGAELAVMNGCTLEALTALPMWLLEINLETSSHFGFAPSELLRKLANHSYSFAKVQRGYLTEVEPDGILRHGDMILCFCQATHSSRLSSVKYVATGL